MGFVEHVSCWPKLSGILLLIVYQISFQVKCNMLFMLILLHKSDLSGHFACLVVEISNLTCILVCVYGYNQPKENEAFISRLEERLGYVCNPRSLKEGTETSRRMTDEIGISPERPIHFECN